MVELPPELQARLEKSKIDDHVIIAFQRFQIRWGEMKNEEGELVGVLGEFYLPYLPWLKFRLPMSLLMAGKIAEDILALVNEE